MNPDPTSTSPAWTPETAFRRRRNAAFTRFGDDGLLVVPESAMQIVLNDTGARLVEVLGEGPATIRQLARRLADEYDGASLEDVERDVMEVLTDLLREQAVETVDLPAD
ncbi:MAG: PqqD family protein [Acidobacteriota bacterium]|nr:PqqD family protein [Acidobacteriota bacterium]MDQ7086514.1 PqqD family protein [Acidobacteriota bacterium]